MVTLILFILGFVALLIGAELLVRGAAQLAAGLGISPLVIGLTIVAYGTGSPELVVSVIASLKGQTDIALGNVIGSNIINTLCILGLSAAICPLIVHHQLIRLDVPIMIGVSLLFWYAASNGVIGTGMGAFFLLLLAAYTAIIFYKSKNGNKVEEFKEEYDIKGRYTTKLLYLDLVMIVLGISILIWGSDWLVNGAVFIAKWAGVSELVIGITIVAFGTSLPELATSVVAAAKGSRDIAVGNIIGSNIFNILAVIGTAAIIAPDGIPVPANSLSFDIPVMTAAAIACLPIFFTGHEISRWEGGIFFAYYLAYTAYIVMQATNNSWLDPFHDAMLYFALPLTLLTLAIGLYRQLRARH